MTDTIKCSYFTMNDNSDKIMPEMQEFVFYLPIEIQETHEKCSECKLLQRNIDFVKNHR